MSDLRCASCPALTTNPACRQVFASGPHPCPTLFLGGGPAKVEDARGYPYAGKAGEEFDNTYLSIAGLYRDEIAVGNASLCWSGDDRPPSDKRVVDCARTHLPELLDRVKPEVLVLMGGVTNRIVDTRIRLDTHHGRPIWSSVLGGVWEGWVWPSYEPALGMRETTKMTQLMEDFRHLGEWLKGKWEAPFTTDVTKDYQIANTIEELRDYLISPAFGGMNPYSWPGVDTERHGSAEWSVQVSLAPNTGRLIRASNKPVLERLSRWFEEREIALHFAGQDLDELDRIGLRYGRFRDTMQEAYHQCSLPQGLKPLVYRLFGVTMRSWEDVVWPASIDAFLSWSGAAITVAESNPIEEVTQLKRGKCVECGHLHSKGPCKREGCGCVSTLITFDKITFKATAIESVLRHVVRHTESSRDEEEPYHPWKKLAEMRETGLRGKVATRGEWEAVEEIVGTTPILGIGNVQDERDEIAYSVGDSDWTGRVAAELAVRRSGEEWEVHPNDYDK